jgi:hypothetical protein
MFALPSAFMWGGIIGAVALLVTLAFSKNVARSIWAGVIAFVPMFVTVWIAKWGFNIVEAGLFGGYAYLVFFGALSLIGSAVLTGGKESKAGTGLLVAGSAAAIVFTIVSWIAVALYYNVGASNNTAWGALGNIKAAPKTEHHVLPDTDANEFIVTDCHLAYTRAHSVLGSNGNNLGSYYDVHEGECVQQWIAGRNWLVFPLQLNSWGEWAGFMTRQRDYSAGYVAVPADDPDGDVKIVDTLHLQFMTGSYFSDNLERHVYSRGYSDGYLVDPTMEIDDAWKPFITVTYVKPAFVLGGNKVVKVLVIDPATGKIDEYAPNEVPAWVDRVNSDHLVLEWAKHYGLYSVVPDFFNSNKAGQMKPDTVRIVNVKGQHQVFQIPMLANNDKAISSNGLIIYDSRKQEGTFYEGAGASGLPSYSTLKTTFESITQNTRGWHVDHIQWYQIRGVATFMAIYAKEVPGRDGSSKQTVFAGVGFLTAGVTNSAEVQYGTSRDEALEKYYDYLSGRTAHSANADETVTAVDVTGVVLRIGTDGAANGHYTLVLKGDRRIYTVPRSVNPLLPLVQQGDTVKLNFDEPAHPVDGRRSARKLVDVTLDEQMGPAQAPAPLHPPAK